MPLRDRVRLLFQRRHAYRTVFKSDEGRLILADLLRFARYHDPVIVPGDPLSTGFADGQRRIVTRIIKLTEMTEEQVLQMANQPEEVHHDLD